MRCSLRLLAVSVVSCLAMGCHEQRHAARYLPTPGTSWQIQFTGSLDTAVRAQVFDIDLFDTPEETIDGFHVYGTKVVCYLSAGTYEAWRPDANAIPEDIRGKILPEWPGEQWLDIRRIGDLRPIMSRRLDIAVQKGCDAIDADNVDAHENDTGFAISAADQLAYNRMLGEESHKRGLSIGLKNDLPQVKDLVSDFDFAINESCAEQGN